MKLPVLAAVLVDELGQLYIVTAVFGDLVELAFLEPPDGLQALRSLLQTERGGGDRIQ